MIDVRWEELSAEEEEEEAEEGTGYRPPEERDP